MRFLHFSEAEKSAYPICFLVPTIRKDEIQKAYLEPFSLDPEEVLVMDLPSPGTKKKTPISEMRTYIKEELSGIFTDLDVEYIAVADAEYFKALTNAPKADANIGYVMESAFGPQKVIYVPNYQAIFYDPVKVKAKINQAMTALCDHRNWTYNPPGHEIIKQAHYPKTVEEIREWMDRLLEMDVPLAIDIEAFSLKHPTAGIATISFSWSKHEGIAFPVDYVPIEGATEAPFGCQTRNEPVRNLLRYFFARSRQKATYHNIAYDAYILIYQLYMENILDTAGLLRGMSIVLRNWDCTKLITYLATNSCAGNRLSLKDQAQEFAGNYAMGDDIKDITRIPLDRLLEYNLVDGLSTWHVKEKHWDTLVVDQQQQIYEEVFKPATLDIIQMQLTGLPVNMTTVKEVRRKLEADEQEARAKIQNSAIGQAYTDKLRWDHVAKRNAELKKKTITINDPEVAQVVFNPGSSVQLQDLLYEQLELPVIAFTDTKQPSTKAKVLKDLQNHTKDPDTLAFLDALLDYAAVAIILETFVPAMENATLGPDGWHYLFGNFNLGGTLSGRLSSSDPNLQNIPANSKYAKLIKSCFEAPPGWIFAGLDFNSLEDRISALTTRDPNKLKVYTDGYDGHSLRAHAYFGDQMPDIDPASVESINSIQEKYKPLRQESKAPTFALTYQGTFNTLMTNCGFSMEKAQMVEGRYKALYKVSIDWVAAKLDLACKQGYVTAAFGLRVRTPLLHQVIRGTSKTPYEAEAEGRSAGNALGQSWCLLNSRAASEFMGKVRASDLRLDIRPCAQIHDAQYYLLRDDVSVVVYTNKHLVQAVQWQDHPDIWHDEVKLGGELSLFFPTWAKEITIPNGATEGTIPAIIEKALSK